MGLYDTLVVTNYPLPDGIKRKEFQTKDLECFLEQYEIRADGTLWHQEYDIEDHSDPSAEGIAVFRGMCARVNPRWVKVDFTGVLNFYDYDKELDPYLAEFNAHFVNGRIHRIDRVFDAKP